MVLVRRAREGGMCAEDIGKEAPEPLWAGRVVELVRRSRVGDRRRPVTKGKPRSSRLTPGRRVPAEKSSLNMCAGKEEFSHSP